MSRLSSRRPEEQLWRSSPFAREGVGSLQSNWPVVRRSEASRFDGCKADVGAPAEFSADDLCTEVRTHRGRCEAQAGKTWTGLPNVPKISPCKQLVAHRPGARRYLRERPAFPLRGSFVF